MIQRHTNVSIAGIHRNKPLVCFDILEQCSLFHNKNVVGTLGKRYLKSARRVSADLADGLWQIRQPPPPFFRSGAVEITLSCDALKNVNLSARQLDRLPSHCRDIDLARDFGIWGHTATSKTDIKE